ncbi:MAG: tetratricopeptide repeat protein [Verrucomicrobia bacterium]|nr:tetratricopeptide repeat protein [Verrucomicrobiota bacterium]
MPKLIRYCEGVVEASWLAALVGVPLFFSVLGERIQNEKNYLLRSLAMVALGAWVIRNFCQWWFRANHPASERFDFKSLLRTPLVVPAISLTVATIVSTILSLSPWESFWGTIARRDGTFTYLSCVFFFAAMAAFVRSRAQVDRIITTSILTSIPICLYGIGQRFSVDQILLPGITDFEFRVGSTFTNSGFLAAYLILIFPLTVSRLLTGCRSWHSGDYREHERLIQTVVHGLTAVLQLFTILFTVSRGPILGLLASLCVMVLVGAIHGRKRWPAMAIIGVGVVLLGGLGLVSWPGGPLQELAKEPTVERFVQMLDPKSGSSGRSAIWGVAAQASKFSRTVETSEGGKDPLRFLRFLVGYGPEHVRTVCLLHRSREYNVELRDDPFFDRVHNDFWDTLLTKGILGLAAHLAFLFLMIYHTCKWLGLLNSFKLRTAFWCSVLGGSFIGSLVMTRWQGLGFLGLGVRAGTLFGLTCYLVWVAWFRRIERPTQASPDDRALLLTTLLAGVVAHLVEIAFSFPVESTQLYFWVYAALLLAVGHRLPSIESVKPVVGVVSPEVATSPMGNVPSSSSTARGKARPGSKRRMHAELGSPQRSWTSCRPEILGGILVGLVFMHVGSMLILTYLKGAPSVITVLRNSFAPAPDSATQFARSLPLAVAAVWFLCAVTWRDECRSNSDQRTSQRAWLVMVVSGVVALAYWLVLAKHSTWMIATSRVNLELMDSFLRGYTFTVDLHYGFTFLLILLLAALLPERLTTKPAPRRPDLRWAYAASATLALATILIVFNSTMKWSKAGIMMNRAEQFKRRGEWTLMAAAAQAAMKSTPAADNQYLALDEALVKQATKASDPKERERLFKEADDVLEKGRQIRPLAMHFRGWRGDLYSDWAEAEPDPGKRALLAAQSIKYYEQALVLEPGTFELFNRIATVELAVRKAPDEARRWLERALELCPTSHKTYGLLGDAAFNQALMLGETNGFRDTLFGRASSNYLQAIRLVRTNGVEGYRYALALGKAKVQLQDYPQAAAAYRMALSLSPPNERWLQEERLARLYAQMNDQTNAIEHVEQAITLAPADKRPALITLRDQILKLR